MRVVMGRKKEQKYKKHVEKRKKGKQSVVTHTQSSGKETMSMTSYMTSELGE